MPEITTVKWADVTEAQLLAEGNAPITITRKRRVVTQGVEQVEYYTEEVWSAGWYENPQTHTLSIRLRVRIPDPIDEVIVAERMVLNADEWVKVEASQYVYEMDALLAQKEQREAMEAQQAEQAEQMRLAAAGATLGVHPGSLAVPPGSPRAVRRQAGRAGAG
jgi:hypothetical protein